MVTSSECIFIDSRLLNEEERVHRVTDRLEEILRNESDSVVPTHASQQPSDGLNISPSKDVRQRIDHRETQGVNTDPPLSYK